MSKFTDAVEKHDRPQGVREYQRLLDGIGLWNTDGLCIQVRIENVRKVWDRVDFLITPLSGSGAKWVSADKVVGIIEKNIPESTLRVQPTVLGGSHDAITWRGGK